MGLQQCREAQTYCQVQNSPSGMSCPDLCQADSLGSLGHMEGSNSQHLYLVTVHLKILEGTSPSKSQPPPMAQSQVQVTVAHKDARSIHHAIIFCLVKTSLDPGNK